MGHRRGISGTCLNCEDRYPACHDTCEKYIQAKEDWNHTRKMIKDAKAEARIFDNYKVSKIAKERRHGVSGRRV